MEQFSIEITATELETLKHKLAIDHSTTITSNNTTGTSLGIVGHGIVCDCRYDGKVLAVEVKKKPFWMPESVIENGLRTNLQSIRPEVTPQKEVNDTNIGIPNVSTSTATVG